MLRPPEPLDLRVIERSGWCPSTIATDALWRSCPLRHDSSDKFCDDDR
jgi:hypothetical protein